MSGETNFSPFVLVAREGVGNIMQMLQTIEKTIPAPASGNPQTRIVLSQRKLIVDHYFETTADWLRDVVGTYATQLEDTQPFLADTHDDCGEWFWRIKDGVLQDTEAITVPDDEEWSGITYDKRLTDHTKLQYISEREGGYLVIRKLIEWCDDCDAYHPTTAAADPWLEIERELRIMRP